jgi:hypothetical protein
MGVKRIILMGFDMRLSDDQKQHWHNLYQVRHKGRQREIVKLPFKRHLRCFPDIARDAGRRGIEILNACPDSAIEEFPKLTVNQILDGT